MMERKAVLFQFKWRDMHGPCPFLVEVTVKAFAEAKEHGGLADIAPENATLLDKSEDITMQFLAPAKETGPDLPPCSLAIQKACLITFQTWTFSHTNMVGILIGCDVKKKYVASSVVCSQSFHSLIADPKVKQVCDANQLSLCGVVMPGNLEKDRDTALEYLQQIATDAPAKVCVFVPCLNYPHHARF